MTGLATTNPTRERLRLEGFEIIDDTLTFLIGCLGEALESTGEISLLPYLPWAGTAPCDANPPAAEVATKAIAPAQVELAGGHVFYYHRILPGWSRRTPCDSRDTPR